MKITIFTIIITTGFLIFLFFNSSRLLSKLPIRVFSGAAIYSAVLFVLVNVPNILLGNLSVALLGPFSFLLTSFFTELPFFAIVVIYLKRYPYLGALSLLIIIRKIIVAFTIYSFAIVPFLSLAVEILIYEALLWIAGITRSGNENQHLIIEKNKRYLTIFLTGLVLTVGNSIVTLVNFELYMFFYRLVYANWYIFSYIMVTCVFCTFLGVILGFKLHHSLREVRT
ncbi:MAG: hypothetical protein VX794_09110 [Nitrospinota bacterium]|nr:hypothetical protein [Nitrospinota bacterium]